MPAAKRESMLLKRLNFWLAEHVPWLLGRRIAGAFLNLRGVEVMHDSRGAPAELERALACLDRGIELYPDLPTLWHNRGCCHMRLNHFKEAVSDLDESLRRNPDDGESYAFRGSSLIGLKRFDEALTDFARAEELGAGRAFIYTRRGMLHLIRKGWAAALADFDRAARLEPDNALHDNNRGFALYRLGRFEEAVASLERAIRIEPDFVHPHKNLAWLQATCPDERFRDGEAALRNARRAIELCTDGGKVLLPILAAAHAEAGDFEEAVRVGERGVAAQLDEESREEAERQLSYYRAGEPYREEEIIVWNA
jgi:tetratricopeptide (TPR) repeat protein